MQDFGVAKGSARQVLVGAEANVSPLDRNALFSKTPGFSGNKLETYSRGGDGVVGAGRVPEIFGVTVSGGPTVHLKHFQGSPLCSHLLQHLTSRRRCRSNFPEL
jgi:hypothetical protein